MSKILKRFLLILIILIGAILALPKSEKAGLYEEYFDDKVYPNAYYFSNTGNEKWYCLEKDVPSFNYGEKAVVFLFEYDASKKQYKITYDMGNGNRFLAPSSEESESHKVLQKIAYFAMKDKGENAYYDAEEGAYSKDQTPYNNVTQIALWYTLQQLKVETLGVKGTVGYYFGMKNNNDSDEHKLRYRDQSLGHAGEDAYNIVCSGSSVIPGTIDSNAAYQLYRKVRDNFKYKNEIADSDVKYEKILMAIYTSGDYQNLICVNFEPDEPEPEPTPFEFELKKVDESGKVLSGAKFDVEMTGIKNVTVDGKDYFSYNKNITVDETKKFTNIEQDPGANYITVRVKETDAPSEDYEIDPNTYYKYFRYNNDEWQSWENGAWTKCNSSSFTLQVENKLQRKIDVSGYVFLDGQFGEKNAKAPNGKFDIGESKVAGVIVELLVKRTTNIDWVNEQTTTTGEDGSYKFTIQNGQTVEKYKIRFRYNGVEYENTIYYTDVVGSYPDPSKVSKAKDIDRKEFNEKFSEIKLNKTTQNDLIDYGVWTIGTSKLNISIDGVGQVYGGNYYRMSAVTEEYNNSMDNLNFGIKERGMDLALTMNVDHTDISINGKTTTYDYTDITINTNKELENWLESVLSDNKVNVDVYPTDYYYRIADYANGGISNILKDDSMTKEYAKKPEDELDVKITYKVRMFNQTAGIDAHIKELVYYYNDSAYKLDTINSIADGKVTSYNWENADNSYGTIDGYNGIVITGDWNVSNGGEQYLYLTFTVNKDNGAIKTGEIKGNIVAITSYSTADGLLDRDSSTRSIVSGSDIQYEDDTARAEDVNINISSKVRKISGNVFNDLDKAGINDVVVQLIEITKNNNEYIWQETKAGSNNVTSLVRLKEGDLSAYNYNNTVSETGKYEFLNIAPGNYIVRFIYGDGYNYDITLNNTKYNGADYKSTIDPNYKSEWYNTATYSANASVARDNEARRLEVMMATNTIDSGLGTALDVYANNKNSITSIERTNILNYLNKLKDSNDNEFDAAINYLKTLKNNNDSRSTWRNNVLNNISDEDLLIIVKKLIACKTFMAAETSKVNVPVDVSDNNALKTKDGKTNISLKRNDYKIIDIKESLVNFANVNFGITLRPQVKLELEKHITALKITANENGTGVQKTIVDAKANIQNIINGATVDTTGEQKGLTKIKSTRDNRGFWKVETDVELDQGANLEVEYTYVVKNVGDKDYISQDLVDLYTSDSSEYSENLKKNVIDGLKSAIKGKTHMYGSALGEYYYTGIKANTDAEVVSKVESFGEAINDQLRYDQEISGSDFKKANTEKVNKTIYDTNAIGKVEEIETVLETVAPSSPLTKDQADVSKKIKLTKVLASLNTDENGNIPSYIAEVLKYSSASGARNIESAPGNLSYVHSKDKEMTLNNSYIYEVNGEKYETQDINSVPEGATNIRKANESDEFWGETIMISVKTGENKVLPVQIGIVVAVSVAVIGVGIVIIRKFILAK